MKVGVSGPCVRLPAGNVLALRCRPRSTADRPRSQADGPRAARDEPGVAAGAMTAAPGDMARMPCRSAEPAAEGGPAAGQAPARATARPVRLLARYHVLLRRFLGRMLGIAARAGEVRCDPETRLVLPPSCVPQFSQKGAQILPFRPRKGGRTARITVDIARSIDEPSPAMTRTRNA